MAKEVLFFLMGLFFIATGALADQGEAVFKDLHCAVCHKLETGKTNPSLKEIAQAYRGKQDQLIKYLKGEGESVIKPEKASMMKRYVDKTKALADEERKALADFILMHGDR